MTNGIIRGVFISPEAGAPMEEVAATIAYEGCGLKDDRYARAAGSFNKGSPGKRQVTLMNVRFFERSGFSFAQSRRNLFVEDAELMWLIGREFTIGSAAFRGVKYCDPCERPSNLAGTERSFKWSFLDQGGLIAEVIRTGVVGAGDILVPPPKGY